MASPTFSKIAEFREKLCGAWSLVEFEAFLVDDNNKVMPGAPVTKPWGNNCLGTVLYTQNGYMSATLTNKAFIAPLIGDATETAQWADATDAEVLRLARPMTTYSGPFEVKEEHGEIRMYHHVDIAINPNWIGKPQIRKASIKETKEGQILVLEPLKVLTKEVNGKAVKFFGVLTWKRLPDNLPKI